MKEHKLVSFERFRKSAIHVTPKDGDLMAGLDLNCGEAVIYGGPHANWGFIEKQTVHFLNKESAHPMEIYFLVMECEEYHCTDIRTLEEKLYVYMFNMGNFDAIPSEMRDRMLDVSMSAMSAFWEVVAKEYDEIIYGDLSPEAIDTFEKSVHTVITTWRDVNSNIGE